MSNKSVFFLHTILATSAVAILIITIIWFFSGSSTQLPPRVTIPLGKITGKFETTRRGRIISAFLGIPYAKPTLHELRFKNSLPIEPWNGTFFADKNAPMCPQILENGTYGGAEDCLVINIYTPQVNPNKLLPVMVYIHGGAFVRGDATSTSAGPTYLLDYDIVLVSVQYRLGVLGFLSTGDKFASGNFGLKDQALALRWIQEYISYFGGDPNSITLFGESAGGVSVNFHVLSTATKGLFHRYIVQSGSALCPWAFTASATYKQYAALLGEKFNCPTNSSEELISCLQDVDVFALVNTEIFTGMQKLTGVTWVPTDEPDIEGAFLIETPLSRILRGEMLDLPNISGIVKDEGLLVTIQLYANDTLYDSLLGDFDKFLNFITETYIPKDHAATIAGNIKEFYFNNIDLKNKTQTMNALTNLVSDAAFIFPQELQLQLMTERLTSPFYYYTFEYRGIMSKSSLFMKDNENLGVSHTDDLIYLFKQTPDMYGFSNTTQLSENDENMIDIVTELWTSFAISGIPKTSFDNDPNIWQPYSETKNHLSIGANTDLSFQQQFLEARMRFWGNVILELFIWTGK